MALNKRCPLSVLAFHLHYVPSAFVPSDVCTTRLLDNGNAFLFLLSFHAFQSIGRDLSIRS